MRAFAPVVFAALSLTACASAREPWVELGGQRYAIEIADDDAERARGLMYRDAMAADRGMLFNFHQPREVAFWMKNTLIPLDIVYIQADGTVLSIARNTTPKSEAPIPSGGPILGVLELINALDRGRVVPFDSQYESLVRSLASQAAVALRNARLEDLSFKDALTDVYNRRYFTIRMEEEFRRHCRFGEPLSLALMDLDHFKEVNDRFGHRAGDQALRDVAQLLVKHSRKRQPLRRRQHALQRVLRPVPVSRAATSGTR